MDNLTLDKLSTLLSQRKLVCIDKMVRSRSGDALRFTFDCENGKIISLLLTPDHQDGNSDIKISFG